VVDGIPQKPIEGTSFLYTVDAKNAKLPSRHNTQYFEMFGQWALYNDGWLLSTKVNRAPWNAFGPANPDPLNNQVLELYDLNRDFSQTTDLAAKNPQKVKEMKAAFIAEAKTYQVFPLDASVAAPIVSAEITVPATDADGMLLTSSGRFGGYGFYLKNGKPVWLWNMVDLERLKWEGAGTLAFNNFSGVGGPSPASTTPTISRRSGSREPSTSSRSRLIGPSCLLKTPRACRPRCAPRRSASEPHGSMQDAQVGC